MERATPSSGQSSTQSDTIRAILDDETLEQQSTPPPDSGKKSAWPVGRPRSLRSLTARLVLADIAVMICCVLVATALMVLLFSSPATDATWIGGTSLIVAWSAVLLLVEAYDHRILGSGTEEFARVAKAAVFTGIGIATFA